jgi:hypothetical protein
MKRPTGGGFRRHADGLVFGAGVVVTTAAVLLVVFRSPSFWLAAVILLGALAIGAIGGAVLGARIARQFVRGQWLPVPLRVLITTVAPLSILAGLALGPDWYSEDRARLLEEMAAARKAVEGLFAECEKAHSALDQTILAALDVPHASEAAKDLLPEVRTVDIDMVTEGHKRDLAVAEFEVNPDATSPALGYVRTDLRAWLVKTRDWCKERDKTLRELVENAPAQPDVQFDDEALLALLDEATELTSDCHDLGFRAAEKQMDLTEMISRRVIEETDYVNEARDRLAQARSEYEAAARKSAAALVPVTEKYTPALIDRNVRLEIQRDEWAKLIADYVPPAPGAALDWTRFRKEYERLKSGLDAAHGLRLQAYSAGRADLASKIGEHTTKWGIALSTAYTECTGAAKRYYDKDGKDEAAKTLVTVTIPAQLGQDASVCEALVAEWTAQLQQSPAPPQSGPKGNGPPDVVRALMIFAMGPLAPFGALFGMFGDTKTANLARQTLQDLDVRGQAPSEPDLDKILSGVNEQDRYRVLDAYRDMAKRAERAGRMSPAAREAFEQMLEKKAEAVGDHLPDVTKRILEAIEARESCDQIKDRVGAGGFRSAQQARLTESAILARGAADHQQYWVNCLKALDKK